MKPVASLDAAALTARVLLGRAFLIKTPVCEQMFATVQEWFTAGALGGLVLGYPRLGKTSATRWVLTALQKFVGGSLSWFEVPVRHEDVKTEGIFFQHMLRSVGHRLYKDGTTGDKRDRLSEFLIGRAKRSTTKTVILFFDEAQYLKEEKYKYLQNVSNELDQRGCRLFVLLVGQHQLTDRRNEFLESGRQEIVGRFMTQDMWFPGIGTLPELKQCLAGYDSAQFPEVGGRPFSSYYIPQACEAGWKLEGLAKPMWEAFVQVWSDSGCKGTPTIAMHYVTSSVCMLMNSLVRADASNLDVGKAAVDKAVAKSGYSKSIITLMAKPES
jgi:hypothetical protein